MKLSHFFTGKPYHEIEKSADEFFRIGEYGSAKLDYEKAFLKLTKMTSVAPEAKDRLKEKISKCKDALVLEHKKAAENLTEIGHYEEAEDILQLALELVQDEQLAIEIEERLSRVKDHFIRSETSGISWPEEASEDPKKFVYQESGEEYFTALISTLPKTEQEIYLGYGDPFREGYVKLNQGVFEDAVTLLSQALKANSSSGSFIRLELATAHLNLGNDSEGCSLMEGFLKDYPESLRAYQPLCEVYWQNEEFDKARQLLLNCPEPLRGSPVIHLLVGETLFHAGQYDDAESHYLDYLDSHGWNEAIALALARTFEALGSKEKARKQYSEIMNRCQGCGSRVDPLIKQRYADISLEAGDYSTGILELYLGLVQEVPKNRTDYYQKISMIYELNGNENEACRFRSFAEQSQHER